MLLNDTPARFTSGSHVRERGAGFYLKGWWQTKEGTKQWPVLLHNMTEASCSISPRATTLRKWTPRFQQYKFQGSPHLLVLLLFYFYCWCLPIWETFSDSTKQSMLIESENANTTPSCPVFTHTDPIHFLACLHRITFWKIALCQSSLSLVVPHMRTNLWLQPL